MSIAVRERLSVAGSSAADKVNDLDLISFRDHSVGPFGTADHLTVQFNGDAAIRKCKMFEQARKIDRVRHISAFSVDLNAHE